MKKILHSKTFWINAIALGAMAIQIETGYIIEPGLQLMVLGIINLIVRKLTNEGIELKL